MSKIEFGNKFFEKTLIDTESGIYIEKWEILADELGLNSSNKCKIKKYRLYGGLSDCVDLLEVNNGRLSFIIVLTRGMGIWKGSFEDIYLGWNSPIKSPVHPHFINLEARGGLGWLDGFNEWIVRCGIGNIGVPGLDVITDNMGRKKKVMLTLHGKIANIPASKVNIKVNLNLPHELIVNGIVYERSMFGSNFKLDTNTVTSLDSNSLKIIDTIENVRSTLDEIQMLYHCNFGPPLLEEGARLIAPIKEVIPRDLRSAENVKEFNVFGSPEVGFVEQVYFIKLLGAQNGQTLVMLENKERDKAVSITFSLKDLPCFTLWKNTSSLEEGYVVGLEPGTSYPNHKAFERKWGRVIKLEPKGIYKAELEFSIHVGKEKVQNVEEKVKALSKGVEPKIFNKPRKGFSY
ncbi:MAG: aldose 1-epimerase family protein [Candidatus Bathyarchaeia archaeon]